MISVIAFTFVSYVRVYVGDSNVFVCSSAIEEEEGENV